MSEKTVKVCSLYLKSVLNNSVFVVYCRVLSELILPEDVFIMTEILQLYCRVCSVYVTCILGRYIIRVTSVKIF